MAVENDRIDHIVLSCILRDARMSSQDIVKELKFNGIRRTSRTVLTRIRKLEKEGMIGGYTVRPQSKNFENKVMRIILISFKTSPTFNDSIALYTSYLKSAPFVAFAARTRGEYDWFNIKIFPNTKIANLESDAYRTLFGDIIDKYMAYDFAIVKGPNFLRATNCSVEEFFEFSKKWVKMEKLDSSPMLEGKSQQGNLV